jgi:hypothetical protein
VNKLDIKINEHMGNDIVIALDSTGIKVNIKLLAKRLVDILIGSYYKNKILLRKTLEQTQELQQRLLQLLKDLAL